ncbi:MAG: tetratricopeptide repeat protein, partial [Smithella sp.]
MISYVVYCRICGIDRLPNTTLAATISELRNIANTELLQITNSNLKSHSSVYGRFVIVPRSVLVALSVGQTILRKCAERGVELAIGISRGDIEEWHDLRASNLAGTAINKAARLAFLDNSTGRIALEKEVHDAAVSNSTSAGEFSNLMDGKVKKTSLSYYWFGKIVKANNKPLEIQQSQYVCSTDHVVVYDIVEYSSLTREEMIEQVNVLAKAVQDSLKDVGRDKNSKDLWYQPAGDGGIIVFQSDSPGGRQVPLNFVQYLNLRAVEKKVSIRIGIHHGEITVLEGEEELPVGRGILQADFLSSQAPINGFCFSTNFWEELNKADQDKLQNKMADKLKVEKIPLQIDESVVRGKIVAFPKPSVLFTGMKNELNDFNQVLGKTNFISIEGLGGIGKTEFAAKCIEILDKPGNVVWFDCLPDSNLDTLISSAGYSDVLKGEFKTERAKYSGFTDLIERDQKIILLDDFQNIQDSSFDEFFRFSQNRLHMAKFVFITREHPAVEANLIPIHVTGLKEDAKIYARKLLDNSYRNVDVTETELKSICDEVDGHPLAIDLAMQLLSYGELPHNIISKIHRVPKKGEELSRRLLDEVFSHPRSTKSEQTFLLHFSVFRGDVDKKGITAVVEDDYTETTLFALIDKKMIIPQPGGYYRTHPLIREFCYRRLLGKTGVHLNAAAYYKNRRSEFFNPHLEEEIYHHLIHSEDLPKAAKYLSETGDDFILTGHTNFLLAAMDDLIKRGVERREFYIFYGDIATTRGNWKEAENFYKEIYLSHTIDDNRIAAEAFIKNGEILYRMGRINESQSYFDNAQSICERRCLKRELARSLSNLGLVHLLFGEILRGEEKLQQALNIQVTIKDRKGQAASYDNIGRVLEIRGDLDGALKRFEKSLDIRKRIGDKEGIANSHNNIGLLLRFQGRLTEAMTRFETSLKISEEIGNKEGITVAINNIGRILQIREKHTEAMARFEKSLKISEEIGMKQEIANAHNNIGLLLRSQGVLDQALERFKKCFKLREEIGDKEGIANAHNNIGSILEIQNDLTGALERFKESLKIREEMGNKKVILVSYHNIGTVYSRLKQYEKALPYFLKALIYAKQMERPRSETLYWIIEI